MSTRAIVEMLWHALLRGTGRPTKRELTAEEENARYNAYIAERKTLIDAGFQQSLSYDKAAITVASGALGLSLTFIRGITSSAAPAHEPILHAGWCALVVALLSTLTSFQLSVHAYQRQIKILSFEYEHPTMPSNRRNYWTLLVNIANWSSLLLIVTGVALLTYFVATNVWRK